MNHLFSVKLRKWLIFLKVITSSKINHLSETTLIHMSCPAFRLHRAVAMWPTISVDSWPFCAARSLYKLCSGHLCILHQHKWWWWWYLCFTVLQIILGAS